MQATHGDTSVPFLYVPAGHTVQKTVPYPSPHGANEVQTVPSDPS